jgi:dephospho-CoA kinase
MITNRKPGFKLGVTGGIGSGKTSVCRVFDVLRVPVFSADRDATETMEKDKTIIGKLNSIAGKDLYVTGSLDRMELARIIFNDRILLEKVNLLVHPAVFDHFRNWALGQIAPYVIMEAAILFESRGSKFVDRVATVVAPVEQRIERVIQRNKLSREQVMERMKNQMDDETRIKLSNYVINNSENDMIISAILEIHKDILNFINTQS